MNPLDRLRGIVTVLNTPFTADGHIDADGLAAHVRYAVEAGVAGFLVPAMASEVGKLSREERRLILRTVVEAAGGVPIVGGDSAPEQADRLALAEECLALGCAGVLSQFPSADFDDLVRWMTELDALHPPFLMVQDWDFQGGGIPLDVIVRLRDAVPSFRAIKIEVAGAGPKYSAVREATGGGLHISGGWAVMQMIEGIDRAMDALMPTGLHAIYVRIDRLHRAGRRAEAMALFERILPALAFANQHLDTSIHFFKRYVHTQGFYATPAVRPPILPFDAVHERIAAALIERALALESECAALNRSESAANPV